MSPEESAFQTQRVSTRSELCALDCINDAREGTLHFILWTLFLKPFLTKTKAISPEGESLPLSSVVSGVSQTEECVQAIWASFFHFESFLP